MAGTTTLELLTPNQEQVLSQIRLALSGIGTILVTLGVATPDVIGHGVAAMLDVVGGAMYLGIAAWSLYDKTHRAMVAKVDAIAKDPASPVVAIITTNTKEGRELANSLPGVTTVPSGTSEAVTALKESWIKKAEPS